MSIIANPTELDIAAGVEGILQVGGSILTPGQAQGFYPEEYTVGSYISIAGTTLTRAGGTGTSFDANAQVVGTRQIPKVQPFAVQGGWITVGGINRHLLIGVIDNLGRITCGMPYNYPPEPEPRFNVLANGVQVITAKPCNANEIWMVSSDGNTLQVFWKTAGIYRLQFSFAIPSDVTFYRFFFMLGWQNNNIYYCDTRIDDKVVPLNTSNVNLVIDPLALASSRIIDINNFGITGLVNGEGTATLTHPEVGDATVVPLSISALYLKPKDGLCNTSVVQGDIVQFESNAGIGGTFEATGGTIISALKWQAPDGEDDIGAIDFTYTVGSVVATCRLNVVKRLSVTNVDTDGYYPDLAQNEEVQFTSTCPGAIFSSPSHPGIVTPDGKLSAPTDADDCCFGEKVVVIQVVGCSQTYTFRVRIQPMYPTPLFCGPTPIKWLAGARDYLPNTLIHTGGTSQVKNRNASGIQLWTVTYENLIYIPESIPCSCGAEAGGCKASLTTASRLDNFYNQVKMNHRFSLVDYHTGLRYKDVRLTEFTPDHEIYRNQQRRTVRMRWEGNSNVPQLPTGCEAPEEVLCPPSTIVQLDWEVIEW